MPTPLQQTTRGVTPTTQERHPLGWVSPFRSANQTPVSGSPLVTERNNRVQVPNPFSWLQPKRAPAVMDIDSRMKRLAEQMGLNDTTLMSIRPPGGNPVTNIPFGDPNREEAIRKATGVNDTTLVTKGKYTLPTATAKAPAKSSATNLNDTALASLNGTPGVKVVASGSVYQSPNIQGELANQVGALNASQSEQSALQEEWKNRLFDMAFGFNGNINTDQGLLGYSKSRDALGLLNSLMLPAGSKGNFNFAPVDIGGIIKSRSDAVGQQARLGMEASNASYLRRLNEDVSRATGSSSSMGGNRAAEDAVRRRDAFAKTIGVSTPLAW